MEQKPSVGRIVHYFPSEQDTEALSNGNDGPIAAIVTRVWDASGCVNLTVFPDYSSPVARSSVLPRSDALRTNSWEWPPRV